jgi:hypothetical protein
MDSRGGIGDVKTDRGENHVVMETEMEIWNYKLRSAKDDLDHQKL